MVRCGYMEEAQNDIQLMNWITNQLSPQSLVFLEKLGANQCIRNATHKIPLYVAPYPEPRVIIHPATWTISGED